MECVVGSTREEEEKTVQIMNHTYMHEITIVLWNTKLQRVKFYETEKKNGKGFICILNNSTVHKGLEDVQIPTSQSEVSPGRFLNISKN